MQTMQYNNSPVGGDLNETINTNVQETNSVLAGCNVHYLFRGSVINTKTGRHGIENLITDILMANSAHFKKYDEKVNKNYRHVYLFYGLTAKQIIAKVRQVNGGDKYPDSTIYQYLSVFMKRAGKVDFIRPKKEEDKGHKGRTENRWYLIAPDN